MRVILRGSLFDSKCEYLTNTINTVGAMGAGLALEFRLRVPEMYRLYKEKCDKGEITIGEYWVYDRPNRMGKKILNFPVKQGFNHPSKWQYIIKGLDYFIQNYRKDGITSIAFPTLGYILGKLEDSAVLEMMEVELKDLPISIEIYRNYSEDSLTRWVKEQVWKMDVQEISKELEVSRSDAERLKARVPHIFLLSDLVVFHKMSVRLVQPLYDFGFNRMTDARLQSFAEAQV
ncbi:MAG: macro domain-containing protein [Nitrososphaerales archaeon]